MVAASAREEPRFGTFKMPDILNNIPAYNGMPGRVFAGDIRANKQQQ
jgi:hypothetical protein